MMNWLDDRPYIGEDDSCASRAVVCQIILPIGLLLRDIFGVHFMEPDDENHSVPEFVMNSALKFPDYEFLIKRCVTITNELRKAIP